jgi:hypothetical protein
MRIILLCLIAFGAASCGNNSSSIENQTDSLTTSEVMTYKSINYIDSFITSHDDEIKKNAVLKEQYETACTKQMLPLIDKKGLYDDLPFEFVRSEQYAGKIYGNFVYKDENHLAKVQCIITPEQIKALEENKKYHIRFKTYKFEDGATFGSAIKSIYLPTPNGYLLSAKPI